MKIGSNIRSNQGTVSPTSMRSVLEPSLRLWAFRVFVGCVRAFCWGRGGGESSPQDLGCLWFFVVPKSFVMIEWSLYIWTLIICGEEIWGRGSSILWILPPGKIHIWNEVWFKWSSFSIGWCLGSMLTSSGIFHAPKNLTFPQILGCYSVTTMCSGLKTLHFDGFGVLIQTLNVWNVWLL